MWANSVLIALFSILVGSAPSYAQYQSIFMLPQTPTSVAIPFNNAANGTVLDFGGNGDCIPGGAGYAASYGLARDAGCAYSGLYIPPQQYVLCNALPPAIAGPNPNPGVIIFPSNGSPIVISITGYCGAPSKLNLYVFAEG